MTDSEIFDFGYHGYGVIEGRDQTTKMSARFLHFQPLEGFEFLGSVKCAFEVEGLL